jgi:RNA polymerase sigma-70 factor, ECF subfamily
MEPDRGLTEPSVGDRTAEFLRLLGSHERGLLAFVVALVPSWSDADDIVQEVRTRLWEQFDQYDPTKDFGVWARTIAYWQVLTWRKSAQRRSTTFGTDGMDAIARHVESRAGDWEDRASALRKCLEKLDPPKRKLIELYYSGVKSARELAEELGRSFHSVRHTLQRTRLALADCIEKTLQEQNHS